MIRYSKTNDAWEFIKRRYKISIIKSKQDNFLEIKSVKRANDVDLEVYRHEDFSEPRGAWLFVKRRAVR